MYCWYRLSHEHMMPCTYLDKIHGDMFEIFQNVSYSLDDDLNQSVYSMGTVISFSKTCIFSK